MRRLRADSIMTSRGSVKKVSSYRYIFMKFLKEYEAVSGSSPEGEAYRNLSCLAANMAIIRYAEVPHDERKAALREIMRIRKLLLKHNWFGSKKLILKYRMIEPFRLYRCTKNELISMSFRAEEILSNSKTRK